MDTTIHGCARHTRKLWVVALMLLTVGFTGSASSPVLNAPAQPAKFAWQSLLGIGIEITFGTNIPNCRCCYGGICTIKLGTAVAQNGPLSDEQIADFANSLLPNDQAGIGISENGTAYIILNRNITRPEFKGTQITLTQPVAWDTELVNQFGIAQMSAGTYPILDNGQFKLIPIH